jgi:tetratricopeptide (TPR) repeat protein
MAQRRLKMKYLYCILFIFFLSLLLGCEPIKISKKIEPFKIEPPQEVPKFKKLPYEAVIYVDDTKISRATYSNYKAGVIYEVEFPTGNILKQVVPFYLDPLFDRTRYDKNFSSLSQRNQIALYTSVDNINFELKTGVPQVLEIYVRTLFSLYDSDLNEIALPIYTSGTGKTVKPGFFAYMDNKDFGQTAYQAILNAVKNSVDLIADAITKPSFQISEVKKQINKDPSNAQLYKILANLSLKNNDTAEALAAAQMYVQLNPKDPKGYLLLSKCYMLQRRYKEALNQLEQAIVLAPKDVTAYMNLAEYYGRRGKYEKVVAVIRKYLEQRPDDYNAYFQLALINFKLGKYEEVLQVSEIALKRLSVIGIGIGFSKSPGEYAKINYVVPYSPAERAGLKVNYEILEVNGNSTLQWKQNDLFLALKKEEGTEIKLAVRDPSSNETLHLKVSSQKFYSSPELASGYLGLMALSSLELNNLNRSKSYLDEAEKVLPQKNYYVKLAGATLNVREGQFEKALREIQDEKSDYAMSIKALIYAKTGKFEESSELYRKILKSSDLLISPSTLRNLRVALNPYFEKLEKRAIEYEKAKLYEGALKEYHLLMEISTPEEAEAYRSRVARIISQNPTLMELRGEARKYFLQAEVLFNQNKFEEALLELDRALSHQPFNPQLYFNKAVIHEKLSNLEEAIQNMEIYLQLFPQAPNAQIVRDQIYKWRFVLEREI